MICTKCQQEKEELDFYKRPDRKNKHQSYCKYCFNNYCKERWIKRKKEAVEYKGGKCIDCELISTDFNYVVFDFHHLDPMGKDFDWGKLRLFSWERIKKELDKCICLCSNCHRLRHFKMVSPEGIEPSSAASGRLCLESIREGSGSIR